jgi:hypothetical protein
MVMVVGNHARTPRGRGQMRWRCDVTLDNAFTTTANGDHGFEGRRSKECEIGGGLRVASEGRESYAIATVRRSTRPLGGPGRGPVNAVTPY